MKKIIIPILIVISVLIIFAISIFTIIKGENNTTIDENFNDEPSNIEDIIRHEGGEELRLAPRNINSVMNSYEGAVTQGTLEKNIYKLVVKNIPFLYNLTKTYTEEQIAELYDKNTENINNFNIYSKEEFILICNDIRNNITEQTKLQMPTSIIELTTCEDNEENYSFELQLRYSETNIIRLKTILSKNEEKIEYQRYDELKNIYTQYKGPVTKQEIINQVNALVENAKTIYNNCRDLQLNKILQYYDLHKEELVKLGIQNSKDYLNITNQIVRVKWLENPQYVGFTADSSTLTSKDEYTSFAINANYSTEQSIKLVVYAINANDSINENNPKIKITAEIKESE